MRHFGGNMILRLFKLQWREGFALPPISGRLCSMETSLINPTCSPSLTRYETSLSVKFDNSHILFLFCSLNCYCFRIRVIWNMALSFQLQTPASFAQSVQELTIALQRTGDPANLNRLRPHLELLANIDPSPGWLQDGQIHYDGFVQNG